MANFDLANLALKMVCPTNEIIVDDKGLPSVYVQKAPQTLNNLLNTNDTSIHPAFIVNGQQVNRLLIGKYQGKIHNNRVYSLPGVDPTVNISLINYENYCKNKGYGHHCITAAEWAFLALMAKKTNHIPLGNNNYGKDRSETTYIAIPTSFTNDNKIRRVATGTGPLTWSDTGALDGIWDLNGNVWEWVVGIRLVKGELQTIPYNNAADPECNTQATSSEWRAINAAATAYSNLFVEPDGQGTTSGTVKLDMVRNYWQWATTITNQQNSSREASFANITYGSDLSDFCKMYLIAMALAPDVNDTAYNNDQFWGNNGADERCAFRGGSWDNGAKHGIFSLYFNHPRSYLYIHFGGRPAFYD